MADTGGWCVIRCIIKLMVFFSVILNGQGTPSSLRTLQSVFLVTANRAEVTSRLSSHLTAAGKDEAIITSGLVKCLASSVTPVLSKVYQQVGNRPHCGVHNSLSCQSSSARTEPTVSKSCFAMTLSTQ